jgi:hypothetical protein
MEVDDLLNGRGMGLARAAELSGYPGPRHVLDLASELSLSEPVASETQAIFERMQVAAKKLGAEIVALELELGRAFMERTIDAPTIDERTREIAALQGELRAAHLRAHLELTALLSPQQIAAYNALRGYAVEPPEAQGAAREPSPHQQHHAGP